MIRAKRKVSKRKQCVRIIKIIIIYTARQSRPLSTGKRAVRRRTALVEKQYNIIYYFNVACSHILSTAV